MPDATATATATATAIPSGTAAEAYDALHRRLREIRLLCGVQSLLDWDQETNLPKHGSAVRAEEKALIAGMVHERFCHDNTDRLVATLEGAEGLTDEQVACVREVRRQLDRQRKLPTAFVSRLTETCSLAHDRWVEARKSATWSRFAPGLTEILALKREEAELVGYETEAYDALLDEYEPGQTAASVGPILTSLREALVPLVDAIAGASAPAPIEGPFPKAQQAAFSREVAAAMGFDFDAGRLDVSAHPFCSGFEPRDVRLTTRYNEADLRQALFGVIHEAGHGIYEQGLSPAHFGTPLSEAASTGIHESQSRMWENMIARSRPFWDHFYPSLQAAFPEALAGVGVEAWQRWVNVVEPSLIRVEADEVTYNLHILLRFELERALLRGELEVADLPGAWNERMKGYLGLTPPDDAAGVLQDIHWSFGGFGYFPTYSLGNLYAAQMLETMEQQIPGMWDGVGRGELLPIKGWLNEHVHRHGMRYPPAELIERLTGAPLSAKPFVRYLETKFRALYGL